MNNNNITAGAVTSDPPRQLGMGTPYENIGAYAQLNKLRASTLHTPSQVPPSRQPSYENWSGKIRKLGSLLGEELDTVRHALQSPQHVVTATSQFGFDQTSFNARQNLQTLGSNFQSVLRQPITIHGKCQHVSQICKNLSTMELVEIFPVLVADVFTLTEGSTGWGMTQLEPRTRYADFHSVYTFLTPGGLLFEIVEKLSHDHTAVFPFPISCLPGSVLEGIEGGIGLNSWYTDRLSIVPGTNEISSSLRLNALEYYLCSFAYFIVHPRTRKDLSQWTAVEDNIYIRLLEDYLNYFLPLNGAAGAVTGLSRSPMPSSSSHLDSRRSSAYINKSASLATPSLSMEQLVGKMCAESFLQIVCDFWLAQDRTEQTSTSSLERDYFLPTVDHGRVVRILVKYLHLFVNSSNRSSMQTFVSTTSSSELPVDEFKSVLIPALLQKKLFQYLKKSFLHWPLDGSFRMILETWLSYIQPWRYQDQNCSTLDEVVDIDFQLWKPFIAVNLSFYGSLFQAFLPRAMRYDIMSIGDVQLIYRVAKVFSQPSLMELLQEVESEMLSASHHLNWIPSQASSSSYMKIIPSLGSMQSLSAVRMDPNFEPLFSDEVCQQVLTLSQKLADTVVALRHRIVKATAAAESNPPGLVTRVWRYFQVEATTTEGREKEEQRLVEYLERSCYLFTAMFKLPMLQTMPVTTSASTSAQSTGDTTDGLPRPGVAIQDDETLPDCIVTDNGIMLTNKGRYQIIQGLRHFEILHSGDPELQPIRSFECAAVIRQTYKLSTIVNEKYSVDLERVYNRKDLIGRSLRHFSKGVATTHYVDTPVMVPHIIPPQHVTPRISLRFVGSYYFLGYFCWIAILARLFGFSWISILLFMTLIFLVCVVYNIDSAPIRAKTD